MVIAVLLFVAHAQTLPVELQTVNLRIAAVHDSAGTVYVVTSNQLDLRQPVHVESSRHYPDHNVIKGEHMKRVAELVARDSQWVFVLSDNHARLATPEALKRAGIASR